MWEFPGNVWWAKNNLKLHLNFPFNFKFKRKSGSEEQQISLVWPKNLELSLWIFILYINCLNKLSYINYNHRVWTHLEILILYYWLSCRYVCSFSFVYISNLLNLSLTWHVFFLIFCLSLILLSGFLVWVFILFFYITSHDDILIRIFFIPCLIYLVLQLWF